MLLPSIFFCLARACLLDLDWNVKILFIVWRACITCPIWRFHGAAEVWLTHIKGYLPSSGEPRQILKQRLRGKSTRALQSSRHSIKSVNSLLLHLKSNPGYISNPLRHISSLHIKCWVAERYHAAKCSAYFYSFSSILLGQYNLLHWLHKLIPSDTLNKLTEEHKYMLMTSWPLWL